MSKRMSAPAVSVLRRGLHSGFTLIELLVVLVILGLLAGIVAPNFLGEGEKAKVKTTQTQMEQLGAALDMYRLEVGRYPSTSEGLRALVEAPADADRWNGPYLKKLPKDGWGNDFDYRFPGNNDSKSYDISSMGPDSQQGSDDDVVN